MEIIVRGVAGACVDELRGGAGGRNGRGGEGLVRNGRGGEELVGRNMRGAGGKEQE